MYEIDRYHDFCAGHRVAGHENKCANLHGHNYRVTFHCTANLLPPAAARRFIGQPEQRRGTLDNLGRVIDFSDVKTLLCQWLEDNWDHKFLMWEMDPLLEQLRGLSSIVVVPFNPTAENMAEYLVNVVGPVQLHGTGIVLSRVRVEETRKCAASYSL